MPPINICRRKIILIGCGPHYQSKYHCVLEENAITIALLIDLEDKREEILAFFQDKNVKPSNMLFLGDRYRNEIIPEEIEAFVTHEIDLSLVDGVMICTEPKARKPYSLWALGHNFPIFMDKPISAFSQITDTDKILDDYHEIEKKARQAGSDVVVSSERRGHPGYNWVNKYLRAFIEEMRVPITSIDIHFAGGIWNLPHEYLARENHPFKYGYGILLQSGYHYIDLLVTLLSLNHLLDDGEIEYSFQLVTSQPGDQIFAMGKQSYFSLMGFEEIEKVFSNKFLNQFDAFGETDILLIGQAKKSGRILTHFSIKLLGTSLCLRKDKKTTLNLKGKVRQEHVTIHLGPFCSLNIDSKPFKKIDPEHFPIEDFNVTIMNSPLITERKSIITLNRKEISALFPDLPETASMNTYARRWQLLQFLKGKDGNSSLASHRETVKLLHAIYSTIQEEHSLKSQDEKIYSSIVRSPGLVSG